METVLKAVEVQKNSSFLSAPSIKLHSDTKFKAAEGFTCQPD